MVHLSEGDEPCQQSSYCFPEQATSCQLEFRSLDYYCPKGLLCRWASNLMMCVCLSVCLSVCVCVCPSRSDVNPKSCETGFGVSRVSLVKRVKNTVFATFSKKTPIFLQSFFQSFLNLQSFLEIAIFSEKSASFRRNLDQRVVKKRVRADNWSRFLGLVGFSRLTSITLTSKTRIHKLWRVFEIVG